MLLRRAIAFLLCALIAVPPQTAVAATAVFRMPTQAAQSTTPMAMSVNVPFGRVDDPYVANFRATGGVTPYGFEMISGTVPTGMTFNPSTGDISGTPPVAGSWSNIKVRATDQNGSTATSTAVTITIVGRPLSLSASVPPSGIIGQPYKGTATTKGGVKPVVFSIYSGSLPAGLTLDAATGEITGTPTTRGTNSFSIRAIDSTVPTPYVANSGLLSITVDYAPLAVSCPPCGGVQTAVGNRYDATFVATGGRGPYSYYVQQGQLPPGISLETASGRLSGAPTKPGIYGGIVVQATDQDSRYVLTPAFEMTVQASVAVSGSPAPHATLGQAYTASFTAIGGREPYAWTVAAGALPPGLSLSASTGAVSGAPTQVGSYGGTQVRAVDADGRSAVSNVFSITVATPVAVAGSLVDATLDTEYRADFTASGGRGPYVFSMVDGALPPGIVLDQSGSVAGTPTATGTYAGIVVRVRDADGREATRAPQSITVFGRMALAGDLPNAGTVGEPYAATFTASGGRSPYGYSLVQGQLPTGTSLSPTTGNVSGTPTVQGTFGGIVVQGRDVDGRTATAGPFSVGISDPLRLTVDAVPARYPTIGEPMAISTFTGRGGTVPYVYAVEGELPPGLVYDAGKHTLSGTPTTAGSWAGVVFKVRDIQMRTAQLGPYAFDVASPVTVSISPAPATVGTPVSYPVTVAGGAGPYYCSVYAGDLPPGLTIEPAACRIVGTPTQAGAFSFAVSAVDSQGRVGVSQPFEWPVRDPLSVRGTPPSVSTVGVEYAAQFDVVGGQGPYSWSVAGGTLPAGLTLDAATGRIAGTPTAAGPSTGLVVRATDATGRTATSVPFAIDIRLPLSIAGNPSPDATLGQAYSATFAAMGGKGPYVFSLAAGALPQGLSLGSSGLISGSPSRAGAASGIRIRVTDADARVATSDAFTITVADSLAVSGTPPAYATVGAGYTATFSAIGGSSPYAWALAAGALPSGLSLDASTGVVAGKPSTAGISAGLQVRATDAAGRTAVSAVFSIDVRDALAVAGSPPPKGTVGEAYAAAFTVSGGRGPYVFGPGLGTLPTGIAIASGGALAGTPTNVETRTGIQIRVVDADGRIAYSDSFGIAISDKLTIAGVPPASVTSGQPYVFAFQSAGGTRPHGFSLVAGTLPVGLSLTTSGSIIGTPTGVGTSADLQVRVSDPDGRTATTPTFSISVWAPLAISGNPATSATIGTPYGAQYAATGGHGPYVFSIVGKLPSGLTFDTAGKISGTPAEAGIFENIVVRVADVEGRTVSAAPFTLQVSGSLFVSGNPAPSVVVGENYSAAFTAVGGTGPYVFALGAGSLPPGISISSAGIVSGIPDLVGGSIFRVQATDANGITALSPEYAIQVVDRVRLVGELPQNWDFGIRGEYQFHATGGRGPYRFSVNPEKPLPAGLAIDSSTGLVSGTPTEKGEFYWRNFVVTDADGRVADGSWTISVWDPMSAWIEAIPIATVGTPFKVVLHCSGPQYGCGFVPHFVPSRFPPGLDVKSGADGSAAFTGSIEGTPTSSGIFTGIGIWVRDHNDRSVYIDNITIDVRNKVTVAGTWASSGVVGQPYSSMITADGGRSPLVFSLATGTLPAGVTLDPASGRVIGTPSSATALTGISFMAKDPDGRTGTGPIYTLTIYDPLTIAGTPVLQSAVGSPYSAQFTAAGGHGPYFYSVVGSLPSGLSISSSTGLISGSPTAATTATNISVAATDVDGRRASTAPFTITVAGPLSISGTPSPNARVGVTYAATFAAAGGTSPYAFDLGSGSLPGGLTLTTDGKITGKPTVTGTFTYAVRATDSASATATTPSFTMTVKSNALPLGIGASAAYFGMVGEAFSSRYFGIGGTVPYTYAVTSGAVPDGLILAEDGRVLGIPTTAGTFTFQVTVTDSAGLTATTSDQTVVIDEPLVLAESWVSVEGYVGDSGDRSLGVTGGRGPYTVRLVGDSSVVPPGITVDAEHLRLMGRYTQSNRGNVSWTLSFTVVDSVGRVSPIGNISWYIGPRMLLDGGLRAFYIVGTQVEDWWFNYWPNVRPAGGKGPWTIAFSPVGTGSLPPGLVEGLQAAGECGPWCGIPEGASWYGWPGHAPSATTMSDGWGGFYWTPTTVGTYGASRMTLVDAEGRTVQTDSPVVHVVDPYVWIAALPDAEIGKPYSVDLRASGGFGGYAYRRIQGVLPTGLTLDPATGVISGVPSGSAGLYDKIQFMVDWADGYFLEETSPVYAINVVDPDHRPAEPLAIQIVGSYPPVRVVRTDTDGVGDDHDQTIERIFAASGGTPPYRFTLSPGVQNLPWVCDPMKWYCYLPQNKREDQLPGLRVDDDGSFGRQRRGYDYFAGYMTYVPLPSGQIGNIRVRVTDATGATADSLAFNLDFARPVGLSGEFPRHLAVGDAVDVLGTAVDGWLPMQIVAATLPPGLTATISGRGVRISGTVTSVGVYKGQSVVVRDDYPLNATWRFDTEVHQRIDPLALSAPDDATVKVQDFLTMVWTPTGGTGPYRVKLSSGTLPSDTVLDYRGVLSGTAYTVGTYSGIVMQVTDSEGRTAVSAPVEIIVESVVTTNPGGDCTDGRSCDLWFSSGIPPFADPIAPNVPIQAIIEVHSPYYRAPGVPGWPSGAMASDRIGPNPGDPSNVTYQLVNAPSWLTWTGASVVFSIDQDDNPWWGFEVYGYYNQRTVQALPPPPGSANDQSGYTPGPYTGSGNGSGGGSGPGPIGLE